MQPQLPLPRRRRQKRAEPAGNSSQSLRRTNCTPGAAQALFYGTPFMLKIIDLDGIGWGPLKKHHESYFHGKVKKRGVPRQHVSTMPWNSFPQICVVSANRIVDNWP
jgi:hypothetical protein